MTTNKTLNSLRLDGKWALVCGASKGIGAATARALADLGADVTLVARTEDSLKETFQQLSASGTQRHDYFTADFDDTAALVESLDLVISVDTSLAHLAGALGKPVWVLLAHGPDWRWMLERADSPWYPSARLFRQPAAGDWASVVDQVRAALDAEGGG